MCRLVQGEKRDKDDPGLTVPHVFQVRKTKNDATVPELVRPTEDCMSDFLYCLFQTHRLGSQNFGSFASSHERYLEKKAKDYGFLKLYKEVRARRDLDGEGEENNENK